MTPATKKILVLGSGPIRIGQAAEFDYSGSQACRAIKEEGHKVILLNSNPATIQTDMTMADYIYLKPLTVDVVEAVLAEHRPEGVIATLGGQTALNLCMDCQALGLWEKYGTRVLGTSVDSIQRSEGREDFRKTMLQIGQPVVPSAYVSRVEEALEFCSEGYFPYIIRPDFTLGGTGGGVARDITELQIRVEEGLRASPVQRVLVERYLKGWGEVEAEVVRDSDGNALCVCSMENVDPMGIHTGDSIVVSPVLTLLDRQWQKLRKAALNIVNALEVEGACNVQFAVSPDREEYMVIEVNPRASRSSALASKATGYPIARMAARIALGRKLTEMPNPVTGAGSALSEPAIDYVVVKMPQWPFDSFPQADPSLGTKMKATGEVMALGLNFSQALMKAFRSLDGPDQLFDPLLKGMSVQDLLGHMEKPTHKRFPAMMELLRRGNGKAMMSECTDIHPYFVEQVSILVSLENELRSTGREISPALLSNAKTLGFSDLQISILTDSAVEKIHSLRQEWGIRPGYREVDGCAGEMPAGSGYYYGAYGAGGDPFPNYNKRAIAVIGSGAIRIGQGVEFDYCCVKGVESLRKRDMRAIMINNNPETVSTDYDISDGLYVEPIYEEDIQEILSKEKISEIITSLGGQTSLKVGQSLHKKGVRLLGTSPESVHATEDRGLFAKLLDDLSIPHPQGESASSEKEALAIARKVGFPLMVRPNFVIGGVAMHVVTHEEEFLNIVQKALSLDPDQELLIDRFLPGKEFEIDAVCDGERILIPGIFEHLDPAGVHSGDSIAIFPDISLSASQRLEIQKIVQNISEALDLKGLLNIQFVLNQGTVYVIEANPRASRTIPIVSKLTQIPMVDLAVGVSLGEPLDSQYPWTGLLEYRGPIGVKTPVFSTEKLPGIDHRLGPQMQSTGEALGVNETLSRALWEALRGSGWDIPRKGNLLISVRDESKSDAAQIVALFNTMGWETEATPGTSALLRKWGLSVKTVEKGAPLLKGIREKRWDLIVNLPGYNISTLRDGYQIRRTAIEEGIPCLHSLEAASALSIALSGQK